MKTQKEKGRKEEKRKPRKKKGQIKQKGKSKKLMKCSIGLLPNSNEK